MLLDADLLKKIAKTAKMIMKDVQIEALRSQVVAGTNYVVKYSFTNAGRRRFMLAEIFEPLPFTGEAASLTMLTTQQVDADSELPAGLC